MLAPGGTDPPERRWPWRALAGALILGATAFHLVYIAELSPHDLAPAHRRQRILLWPSLAIFYRPWRTETALRIQVPRDYGVFLPPMAD